MLYDAVASAADASIPLRSKARITGITFRLVDRRDIEGLPDSHDWDRLCWAGAVASCSLPGISSRYLTPPAREGPRPQRPSPGPTRARQRSGRRGRRASRSSGCPASLQLGVEHADDRVCSVVAVVGHDVTASNRIIKGCPRVADGNNFRCRSRDPDKRRSGGWLLASIHGLWAKLSHGLSISAWPVCGTLLGAVATAKDPGLARP